MSTLAVVGTQWGDEGKGKIVDLLTNEADIVARFQGGNNAGHTLKVKDHQIIVHLIPSGILYDDKVNVVGNGLVVDPYVLLQEKQELRKLGYFLKDEQLLISDRAHVIMPYHKIIDHGREEVLGKAKIGTTGRGIGPAYEDKASRMGIRMGELLRENSLRERVETSLAEKNFLIEQRFKKEPLNSDKVVQEYLEFGKQLAPHITDTAVFLQSHMKKGERILFEGAQGTLLDIDHGTYPFVTSSNVAVGNVCCGAGVGPKNLDQLWGVVKAYTTRVGSGGFPTELTDDLGDHIREKGAEYGATTGRPRRCGWLDVVVLNHSIRLNGLTGLALTKLDVLTGISPIKIATSYKLNGTTIDHVPGHINDLEKVDPQYISVPGWQEPISDCRSYEDLPVSTKSYIEKIESLTGLPVTLVSVGPGREQSIIRQRAFPS